MKSKAKSIVDQDTFEAEKSLRIALELEPARHWDRNDAVLRLNADLTRCAHPILLKLPSSVRDNCIKDTLQDWWTHWRKFQTIFAMSDQPAIYYARQSFRYMTLAAALSRFKGRWRQLELNMDVGEESEPTSPYLETYSGNVQQALAAMPSDLHNLLIGRIVLEKTYLQLAAEAGISEATAWRRVHQALQVFRQQLEAANLSDNKREAS